MFVTDALAHPVRTLRHLPTRDAETSRQPLDWIGALATGIAGGIGLLALELALFPFVLSTNLYYPLQAIAAIGAGPQALEPAAFDLPLVALALAIHLGLSVGYATGIAGAVRCRPTAQSILLGTAAGLVLYLFNFHGATAWFPWFAELRGPVTLALHALFGAAVACGYRAIEDC